MKLRVWFFDLFANLCAAEELDFQFFKLKKDVLP